MKLCAMIDAHSWVSYVCNEPPDRVVQTRRVGLVSVRAKADIEDRSTVLELVNKGGIFSSFGNLVKVDVPVP